MRMAAPRRAGRQATNCNWRTATRQSVLTSERWTSKLIPIAVVGSLSPHHRSRCRSRLALLSPVRQRRTTWPDYTPPQPHPVRRQPRPLPLERVINGRDSRVVGADDGHSARHMAALRDRHLPPPLGTVRWTPLSREVRLKVLLTSTLTATALQECAGLAAGQPSTIGLRSFCQALQLSARCSTTDRQYATRTPPNWRPLARAALRRRRRQLR